MFDTSIFQFQVVCLKKKYKLSIAEADSLMVNCIKQFHVRPDL